MKNKEPESSPSEEPNWVTKYNGFNDGLEPSSGVGGGPSIDEWSTKLKLLKAMKESSPLPSKVEMKTAEEILKRYETYVKHSDVPIFLKRNVLEAMEIYASQFKSPDSPLNPSSISSLEEDAEEIAAIIEGELGYTNGWSISDAEYLKHCMNCAYRIITLLSQKKESSEEGQTILPTPGK